MNVIKKPYYYKRFRVHRSDGGSTTVSVDPTLVVEACKELGSLQALTTIVRKAARDFDEQQKRLAKNRSAHVTATIRAVINQRRNGSVAEDAYSTGNASTKAAATASQEAEADTFEDTAEAIQPKGSAEDSVAMAASAA